MLGNDFKHAKDPIPLGENVLLKMLEDDITNSGLSVKSGPRSMIIMPSHLDTNRVVKAEVIDIGSRVNEIKKGDIVLIKLLSGKKINEYNVVHQDLILGVIDG